VEPIYVHVREEVEPAFRRAMASGDDALMVLGDAALASERDTVFELTAEYGIPVMYEGNRRVLDGGLISYGSSLDTRFRRAATYVDRILKGARPADLPVEEPTSFELTINLGAAAAVGVTVPPEVLAQADRVVR